MYIKLGEYHFNHKAIVKQNDEHLEIYTKLGTLILGNILDSKINNPKYEEAILEKFTKHENGNPVHLEYDFMPLSYNELQDIISKRLSREDVLLNNRLKRLGLL